MDEEIYKSIIQRYPKAIANLRKQLDLKRFGLLFGAGVSRPYGLPNWDSLVKAIATELEAAGVDTPTKQNGNVAYQTQILFQHYRNFSSTPPSKIDEHQAAADVGNGWRQIVQKALYKNAFTAPHKELGDHPYLKQFVPVIKQISLLINYNFDDCVERLLNEGRDASEREQTIGFEAIWSPRYHLQQGRPAIFHPNGFLAFNPHEKHSDALVFSEDSFADQILDAASGRYPFLLDYLARNTCLLLGFSLDDTTLKSLLRQNAKSNPGHYHYYVRYVAAGEAISDKEKRAIEDANFNVYNLVTLFLDDAEIAALANLLVMELESFLDHFSNAKQRAKHCYYVVGAVASGKTTLISQFRSLVVYDEWLDARIPEIMKPSIDLTEEETKKVDDWILTQVRKKNRKLQNERFGLIVLDRAPLDAFAFTANDKWKEKAAAIRERVCPDFEGMRLAGGHILVLNADPKVLEIRTRARGRQGNVDYLRLQQENLIAVYDTVKPGVTVLPCDRLPYEEIVRRVASIIHREAYEEFDMHGRLIEVERDGRASPT